MSFSNLSIEETEDGKNVVVNPGRWIVGPGYKEFGERLLNLQLKPDDVIIHTFAKSGTNWIGELVWLVCNDFDIEAAKASPTSQRLLFIDYEILNPGKCKEVLKKVGSGKSLEESEKTLYYQCGLSRAEETGNERFIKTHMPFSLLPPNMLEMCKVVYVVRNPMDVMVSLYNFMLARSRFQGDFKGFFDAFIQNKVRYCPYWSHVQEAWNRRHHRNFCFLTYEEMKENLGKVVIKVSNFFGKSPSEDQVRQMSEHLSFDQMKLNPSVNRKELNDAGLMKSNTEFLRKGIVGDWKNYFTEEMEDTVKKWNYSNKGDCDIKFPGVQLY